MDARPTPIRFESSRMVTERTKVIYNAESCVERFGRYASTERERRFVRAWLACEPEKKR